MMVINNSAIQAIKEWWSNLPKFLAWGGRPENHDHDQDIANSICAISKSAIWCSHDTIEIEDVLDWINDNRESLILDNSIEVNIIDGKELKTFIEKCQSQKQYCEVSFHDLNKMQTSVILVALDKYRNITADQMICSKDGMSVNCQEQFKGQPIIKIIISTE